MKRLLPFLLLAAVACKDDPGGGVLTGTSSPEAEARRATEAPPPGNDTALTGTFSSDAPGNAPGTPAETGTHPGATGTDATTLTDPNVSTTDASTTAAPLQNRTGT
ncbi:MAG: hypothetical protein QOJ98_2930 [Acidobacteriota bacterium]|jgi:hypothetical protein|nr:hypothetical protein [Acidobacteriota bacterium]